MAHMTTSTTGSTPSPAASGHTVTLIGKPGCHLCDDARAVVSKVAAEVGASVAERDITQDAALYDQYWEQIPVVLVDGVQHTFWRVDEARLRRALTP
jgi:glutaredoxin